MAQNTLHGPLSDRQRQLQQWFAILTPTDPLMCALRGHADGWLGRPIRAGFRLVQAEQVTWEERKASKPFVWISCGQPSTAATVNSRTCVATPHTFRSQEADFGKIQGWIPGYIGRMLPLGIKWQPDSNGNLWYISTHALRQRYLLPKMATLPRKGI